MSGKKEEAPPVALQAKSAEKMVEYQAFGSSEKVALSIAIVRKWIAAPTKSGKFASDGDVMRFIMLCKARQLNPWEGDAFLIGYDSQAGPSFSLITAHQAFLKRAEAHGQFDGMKSGVIVEDSKRGVIEVEGDFVLTGQTLLGGWCDVFRKDHSHPKKARLKLDTFDKGFGQWKTNAAGMIVKCAEADALRGSFPNTLGGMYNDAELALRNAGAVGVFESAKEVGPPLITEDQRTALVDLAKEKGVVEKLGAIVAAAGFEMLGHITADKYDDVQAAIVAAADQDANVIDAEYEHIDEAPVAKPPAKKASATPAASKAPDAPASEQSVSANATEPLNAESHVEPEVIAEEPVDSDAGAERAAIEADASRSMRSSG